MQEFIIKYINHLSTFGQVAIVLNILFFVLSGVIFRYIVKPTDDDKQNTKRIRWLRFLNFLLLMIYVIDALVNGYTNSNKWLLQMSQTGLVLLISYLFIQFSHAWALQHYGKDKSIDGEDVSSRTYKSEMMHIIIIAVTVIASILLLVNIWHVTNWLQATGVLGGLLVILFATKDAWAVDSVHGLILLYNHDLEPGVICRIPEHGILGVVRKISLTQTTFRDIVQKHKIVIPNSKLRTTKIEILNRSGQTGWNDYIEFKISYSTTATVVEKFFEKVWEVACEKSTALNIDKKPKISLIEAGDHAIVWRLHYYLANIYQMKPAKFCINRTAFDLQNEFGLSLSTPITHQAVVDETLEDANFEEVSPELSTEKENTKKVES
jgi:small-conductance mechanosensitive channel